MKKEVKNRIFFVNVAFWGLLAVIWIAGAWKLYYELIETFSESSGIPQEALIFVTILLISGLFILFQKQLSLFGSSQKMVHKVKRKKRGKR